MSVVVGVFDEKTGVCAIAADSIASAGNVVHRDTLKVHSCWGMRFGHSGNKMVGQMMLRLLDVEATPSSKSDFERAIVAAYQALWKDLDKPKKDNFPDVSANWLVATPWGLLKLECNGGLSWRPEDAIGYGMDVALGSLHATRGQDPATRVRAAVEAACEHTAWCSLPVQEFRVQRGP